MADDYEVGFKKPPKHAQFKKGQSGNPKGRPNGTRNFKTDLREELDGKIRVQEGPQGRVISKQQALIKRLLELALKGNMRAIQILTGLIPKYFSVDDVAEVEKTLSEEDRKIQVRFVRKKTPSNGGGKEGE